MFKVTSSGFVAEASIVAFALSSFLFASCNKDKHSSSVTSVSEEKASIKMSSGVIKTPDRIDVEITTFYEDMKRLRLGGISSERMTPDDVNFFIEGTYNKYVAERQFDCNIAKYESSIAIPVGKDGLIGKQDIAGAFWKIRDVLLEKSKELGGDVKMESFDMDHIAEKPTGVDGILTFTFITIFKKPTPGFPINMTDWCNDNFHEGDTHVWKAYTSTLLSFMETGQATINHSTKSLVIGSKSESLPGAALALRAKGCGNIQNFYCQSYRCGYFVNVQKGDYGQNATLAPTSCDYVLRGIPDYNNLKIWNTKFISGETYGTYKEWLTTPMMNFYLSYIPGIVENYIPVNQKFANFHVWSESSSSYVRLFHYEISWGDFVPLNNPNDCVGKIELGYL